MERGTRGMKTGRVRILRDVDTWLCGKAGCMEKGILRYTNECVSTMTATIPLGLFEYLAKAIHYNFHIVNSYSARSMTDSARALPNVMTFSS